LLFGEKCSEEFIIRKDNSEDRVVLANAAPIMDSDNNIKAGIVIFMDITDQKKSEKKLLYLSYHDQLTGLYNRRFFEEALLRIDTDKNLPLTLMMTDVNGLKLINDSFGHNFGDELLKRTANVISQECSPVDILARLGGDEFVLILPNTDSVQAEKLVNRLKKALSQEKVASIKLSVSFGYDTKITAETKLKDVLINAEDSMYKHKVYESSSMHNKTVELIMNTLFEKSRRELMHSQRVSTYCEAIANAMDMERDAVNQIKTAGLLHDIGKIGIDESILNKPEKLESFEWEEMKKHPESSWRILIGSDEFSNLARFVQEHHEHWDGNGYPNGLKKEEISIEARIITLADSYDAMTSNRTYKKAMNNAQAIEEILRCKGKQFDPNISDIFINKVLKNGSY
jgi:diguanylate cyclase (GGDEF)-like protein